MNTSFADVAAQLIQRNFRRTRTPTPPIMATVDQLTEVRTALTGDIAALQVAVRGVNANTKQFDINKSLGLDREKKQYDQRLKALTEPATYGRERGVEWLAMTEAVKDYFEKTTTYLGEAGFDWEDSKEKAKDLAKQFAAIERQKLELKFPTAANVIGAQRQVDLAFGPGAAAGAFNPAELVAAAQPGPIQPARKKASSSKSKK